MWPVNPTRSGVGACAEAGEMWGDSRRKPAPRMQKGRELRTAVALPEASGKCTSLWRMVEGGTATCELRCLIGYSGCRLPWTTRLDKDPRDTATCLRGALSLQAISGLTGELWKVGTPPPNPLQEVSQSQVSLGSLSSFLL